MTPIYMNARYYVPNTNRMLTPDTIVPNPANPQSFNRYSYVNNNPINLIDPSGHAPSNGCDYEGCSLPNSLDPDNTWRDEGGQYYGYDPYLAEKYPGFYSVDAFGYYTDIHAAAGGKDTMTGLEIIYNRHSGEITLFAVVGFGGGAEMGVTNAHNLILVGNIGDDNLNYSGDFVSLSIRGALGVGGNVGYAWVPGDDPFDPEQAYAETYGATVGAGAGFSYTLVEYIPIVTTTLDKNAEPVWHTTDYLYDPDYPYDNGFITGMYDKLMELIEIYEN